MGAGELITMGGVAAMLVADRLGWQRGVAVAKPLASSGFLIAALSAGALESTYGRIVALGLMASWVGDVALLSRQQRWFLLGLVAFATAHAAYALAFVVHGVEMTWVALAAALLVAPAIIVYRWLRPHIPVGMVRPVQVYVVLISTMVALAAGARAAGAPTLVVAGAVAFYLSDLSVARDRFVGSAFANRLWGWPLYYAAQLMLASTVAA